MPLTNAEKQRRYRERIKSQAPEKYEKIKTKDKKRAKRNRMIKSQYNKQPEDSYDVEKKREDKDAVNRQLRRQNIILRKENAKLKENLRTIQKQLIRAEKKNKDLQEYIDQNKERPRLALTPVSELPAGTISQNEMSPQTETSKIFHDANPLDVPAHGKIKVTKAFESSCCIG